MTYVGEKHRYVSKSTVYRLLKERDLITSPTHILMKTGDQFQHPTTLGNEMWQTDFTYLEVLGWGWYYLSTILDDFSRFIIARRLCTTMSSADVTDTLNDALIFTVLNQGQITLRPRLLSDNGPCYVSSDLAEYLEMQNMQHTRENPITHKPKAK